MKYIVKIIPAILLALPAFAGKASVKVEDVGAQADTSIVIKKGAAPTECVEYQVVEGKEEIFGSPEYEKTKAYGSWKTACTEWKASMRELNKGNQILSLSCARPSFEKEGEQFTYKGLASYRVKTKIRDKR